jgi:ABC-type nitrate/sulfonate/bicarbonate transport system permease component
VQTLYGVQDVDPVATDTARSFGFSKRQQLLRVTLPSAVPYIATGIRMASTVALILAVTAELVIGSAGLGREINIARSGGNVELMYALIIVTGLLGWVLNIGLARAERRVLHWHPSQRAGADRAVAPA